MLGQIAIHYLWWLLALLLILGAVLVPGYFLLWIGIAAAAMGVLLWLFPGLGLLVQAILFAALALAACVAYARWLRPRIERDAPDGERLNRRGERMIGQRYELVEPIVNGRGKVKIDDSVWRAEGHDAPLGTRMIVTGVQGAILKVDRAG